LTFSVVKTLPKERIVALSLKLSAHRNETETKKNQKSFKTVLKLFCFSFISLCGQFKVHGW